MGNIYSKIPKVDILMESERVIELISKTSREMVKESIQEELEIIRKNIKDNKEDIAIDHIENIVGKIELLLNKKTTKSFKNVINGTGVVIHTNLGRSLIDKKVMEKTSNLFTEYSNLEIDLETGKRGSRYEHLVEKIKKLTGAEDALVVNNNAAAVVLILSSLANGKEVITSRGELVEIGGSFRIPEVMEQSGAILKEVGSTNKTHIEDYEKNISENTAAFLKVHTSNYRVVGFTKAVTLEEIVNLGKEKDIPVIEDLGSGVLVNLEEYGLEHEPTVQESVKAGVDIISFSGDKLLGGPQAGVIIGNKKYIEKMKSHPLNRAFRIDKFTIALLEETLQLYILGKEKEMIPTLKMLSMPLDTIEKKAKGMLLKLEEVKIDNDILKFEIEDGFSQVGGGSMPLEQIKTKVITLNSKNNNISEIERRLRKSKTPIVTRLYKEKIYIDLRTVLDYQVDVIVNSIKNIINTLGA